MTTLLTDPETGLSFRAPEGWRPLDLPNVPLTAVCDDPIFAPSIIATVANLEDRDLDDTVVAATAEWLAATPSGQLIDGHEIADPQGEHELRLVHCLHSVGITSVALVSVFVLHRSLLTRIDLSMQAVHAENATALLYDLVETLTAPHRAPAQPPPASTRQFASQLQQRGEPLK